MRNEGIEIVRRLDRRANVFVGRVRGTECVIKRYGDQCSYEQEAESLMRMSGRILVPEVLASEFPLLAMEHVRGRPAASSLLRDEGLGDQLVSVIEKVSSTDALSPVFRSNSHLIGAKYESMVDGDEWAFVVGLLSKTARKKLERSISERSFHATCYAHGDIDFGNIIVKGRDLYLIDWEMSRIAECMLDWGHLVHLGILSGSTSFVQRLMDRMAERYNRGHTAGLAFWVSSRMIRVISFMRAYGRQADARVATLKLEAFLRSYG